ncbi:RluA family pseudouridine synthase [Ruminiclostridium cellobioparum]|uniref:Pseudouridine synthase n=1 Tax=Ruminiclostridium cellobioparum subsp. termitidis CT1112 TaxID=1195236 RepID=S0FPG0_RUMCE|nr:RluA family pseudouridine synthase [Ruminiclostridium cellobioparum]EMS71049.1 pseudouridine synthase, RluA family [Ruminiclostridium cellobioparum subsp. termitidis CT1112]
MRTIIAKEKHSGKKIDKVIRDFFPNLSSGMLFKTLRKKDIKVNGIRVREDYQVLEGDKIDIYIIDDYLLGKNDEGYSIVYEDNNIMVVSKAQGVPVHPDRNQTEATLIDKLQKLHGRHLVLCHRLDRNTAGLVILAKNNAALDTMLEKIKEREIHKYYTCIVSGIMEKSRAELVDHLEKNDKISKVFISDKKTRDSLEIVTRYRVLKTLENLSMLEVELVTGRTHQIRAHLAHYGHPIIGDGKYGRNSENKQYGAKYQMLCASRLIFDFKTSAGPLNYLNGKTIAIEPPFSLESLLSGQKP